MEGYARTSMATAPDGRRVLVSTVRNSLACESMGFGVNDAGEVTSLMHLFRVPHDEGQDLDAAHEMLVQGVSAGAIELLDPDRDPTQAEDEDALGDLLLLGELADDGAMDDGPTGDYP